MHYPDSMHIRTCWEILYLLTGLISVELYGQQETSLAPPVVSLDFETECLQALSESQIAFDSVADGIHGKAAYFSKEMAPGHLVLPQEQDYLSDLWSGKDFSVELWVQTRSTNGEFQVIATNKDWSSGEIHDFTDNRYFGLSRKSGMYKGWAIVCQPDGSWAWNIGNGDFDEKRIGNEYNRKDYKPTAQRQRINDGIWHQIAFTINREANEARLYFDGRNVAIYYMGQVKDLDAGLPLALGSDALAGAESPSFEGAIDEFRVYDFVLNSREIARNYQEKVPAARLPELSKEPVKELNLMAWNIWHGGRRTGRETGPQQVIAFIKDTGTDIVMMQETYGSAALIADALGYYYYLASANISVISRYPIEKTWIAYHELWCGISSIRLSTSQTINLASIWLHYLPGWRTDSKKPDATPEKLIAGEEENRHREIKIILETLEKEIQDADGIPLIMGGDFNSPSHNDWTGETLDWHNGLVVEWPVSKEMWDGGFTDSFREIHPDLNYASPTMSAERLSYKIDYIYYMGRDLKATDSDMHYKYKGAWPSDHPAVTTTLRFK